MEVARNPNTTQEVLMFLTNDKEEDVRVALTWGMAKQEQLYEVLAKDRDPFVRRALARQINISLEVLFKLMDDVDETVKATAIKFFNKRTPT